VIFTDWIVSIANFVSIYRENHNRNRRNFKKPNNTMTCKFLRTPLPMKLLLDSNRKDNTVTCHLYRHNYRRIDRWKNHVDKSIGYS
jgi:hypothetical protein